MNAGADPAPHRVDRVRLRRRDRVPRRRRVPQLASPPPAPAAPGVHLGRRDLVDRSAVRLGDVRAVPGGDPTDAVVVAGQHDLGWAAVVGADRLHRLLRAARGGRRGARQSSEREVRLAAADRAAGRRVRRRLRVGVPVQRDARRPARRLLLRPRDPGAGDLRGDEAPVPDLRRVRDGAADDGLRLPARPDRCGGPQPHRGVGRLEDEEPAAVVAALGASPSSSSATSSTWPSSRPISPRS